MHVSHTQPRCPDTRRPADKRPLAQSNDAPYQRRSKRHRKRPDRLEGTPGHATVGQRLAHPAASNSVPVPAAPQTERHLLADGFDVIKGGVLASDVSRAAVAAQTVVGGRPSRVIDNGRGPLRSQGRLQVRLDAADGSGLDGLLPFLQPVVSALRPLYPVLAERLHNALQVGHVVAPDAVEFHLVHFDPDVITPRQCLHMDVPLTWRQHPGAANAPLAYMPFFLLAPLVDSIKLNVSGRVLSIADDARRPSTFQAVSVLPGDVMVCCGDLKHGGSGNTTHKSRLRLHIALVPKFMNVQLDESFTRLRDDRSRLSPC